MKINRSYRFSPNLGNTHGLTNKAMRMIQGGKFEHGFLSGFVSSLGGTAMMKYGANMDIGAKVAVSAALGGTAEALGGGKFANGAVTGAYVMMFNHLQERGDLTDSERKRLQKERYGVTDEEFDTSIANEFSEVLIKGLEADPYINSKYPVSGEIADIILSTTLEPEGLNYSAKPMVTKVEVWKNGTQYGKTIRYSSVYTQGGLTPVSNYNPGTSQVITTNLSSGYQIRYVVRYLYVSNQ